MFTNSPLRLAVVAAMLTGTAGAQTIVNSFSVPPLGSAFVGGVDYDPGSDTIWTADETNDIFHQFDRAGNLLQAIPAQSPPGTTLSPQPIGVGVDPLTGNLWVGDEGEYVYEMTPAGVPTGVSWSTQPAVTDVSGVAFDPVTGHIFVSQDSSPQTIVEFDQAGVVLMTINLAPSGSTDPDGLAYNPITDTFYLGEDANDRIIEVDRTGNWVGRWNMAPLGISPEGLGIDPTTGSLFIGDGSVTRMVYEVSGIVPVMTMLGVPDQLSVSAGGSQVLSMDVDDSHAGKSYQVLGTASGTTPGFPYTGQVIPLNPDGYTIFTLLNPNTPPLSGSGGILNSLGQATTVLTVPPGSDPALIGLTFHHAGVVIELLGGFFVVTDVTVAAPVTLLP
jgi:hypothetical protein